MPLGGLFYFNYVYLWHCIICCCPFPFFIPLAHHFLPPSKSSCHSVSSSKLLKLLVTKSGFSNLTTVSWKDYVEEEGQEASYFMILLTYVFNPWCIPFTCLYTLLLDKIMICSSGVTVSGVNYPSTVLPCLYA